MASESGSSPFPPQGLNFPVELPELNGMLDGFNDSFPNDLTPVDPPWPLPASSLSSEPQRSILSQIEVVHLTNAFFDRFQPDFTLHPQADILR